VYTSNTPAVCTVNPTTNALTLLSVGSCTIKASQIGDASHVAATPVFQRFLVEPMLTPGANNITFNAFDPPNYSYIDAPPIPAATASSLLLPTYDVVGTPACTVTPAGSITFVSVGPCTIRASQAGNASFPAAQPASQTFIISPAENDISFSKPSNRPLTSSPPVLVATASSGQPVTFALASTPPPGPCSVTPAGTVTLNSVGVCAITASQGANGGYAAADDQTQFFDILPSDNVITFQPLANTPFNATPPVPDASSNFAGLSVTYSSATASVCTVTPAGLITFISIGSCSITANQPGNLSTGGHHGPAEPVTRAFDVLPVANVIAFAQPGPVALSSGSVPLSASASSMQPVTYSSAPASICTVSATGLVSLVSVGTCSVTVSQDAVGAFAAATPVTRSFNITGVVQAIAFPVPLTAAFVPPPAIVAVSLGATDPAGPPVVYTSNTPGVCSVTSAGAVTSLATGLCTLTASSAASVTPPSTPATRSLTILPATSTITFPALANTPFTSAPPAPAATASSGLPVTYASATQAICTVAPAGAITFVKTGTCSVTASSAGNASYAAATPVSRSFQITTAGNVITFVQPPNMGFTTASQTLAATASSGLPVALASTTPTVCTVGTGNALRLVRPGTCTINATQAGNASIVAATAVSRTFTITRGANVITFDALPNAVLGRTAPVPRATASSRLPVQFASTTTTTCTVSLTGTIRLLRNGTCSIRASQAGNSLYLPAATVTRSFTIGASAAQVAARTVSAPSQTVLLTTSTTTPGVGEPVSLTASVSQPASEGTFSFSSGETTLCEPVASSGATASCTVPFATTGQHNVTASFNAGGSSQVSTSAVVRIDVGQHIASVTTEVASLLSRRNDLIASNGPDASRQIERLGEAAKAGRHSGKPVASMTGTSLPAGPSQAANSRMNFGAALSAITSRTIDKGRPTGNSASYASETIGGTPFGSTNEPDSAPGRVPLPLRITGRTEGAITFGFSTSLQEFTRTARQIDTEKLKMAGSDTASPAPVYSPLDIWVSGTYVSFETSDAAVRQDGHFGMVSLGADYVLSPSVLLGIAVQYDDIVQDQSANARDEAEGRGWLAGPYATLRLSDGIYWQSRAAWGKSDNSITTSQGSVEEFDSERWLVSSTLSGRWNHGAWWFRPSASISYLEDQSESFVDALGISIPEVTTSLGQAKAGPEVGTEFSAGSFIVQPRAGFNVIWNFADDASAPGVVALDGSPAGVSDVRGSAEVGVRIVGPGAVSIDAQGTYDGIGSKDYEAVSGRASLRVPLN
jgi:outer membrane autotransporter protein